MRCRPGDLALIIRGKQSGLVVRCERLLSPQEHVKMHIASGLFPVWRVDRALKWRSTSTGLTADMPCSPDAWLLPIRPEPDDVDVKISTDVPVKEGVA